MAMALAVASIAFLGMFREERMNIKNVEEFMKGRKPGSIGLRKDCAVLIPLVEREDGMHLLFERRSSRMKTQPGDVCFPGGRMEPGESPVDCALRETEEEIGIPADRIRVIGQFDTMYEITSITMNTVIGVIEEKDLELLRPNPEEVDVVFTVPYRFFEETEPFIYEYEIRQMVDDFPYEKVGVRPDYRWRVGHTVTPVFHYGEGEDRQLIWGLTARIVTWLIKKLEESKEHSDEKTDCRK